MTVLIVDDNPGIRRLLRRILSDDASEVWECSDGADAQTAYLEHWPDVVLMDIHMPGLDGFAASRRIREIHDAARIVIITDYDEECLRDLAAVLRVSGFLSKQDLTGLCDSLRLIIG